MREDESIQEQTLELVANVEAAASAEKRVAAFASLQAHLEEQFSRNGAGQTLELVEADAVASAIKVMLKNANQSVSAAGLLYLPSYARLLVTSSPHHQLAHNIRALMHAALPLVLERLGDHKDKIKEGAKAAIAEMGSAAFSTGTGAAATAAAGASRAASSRLDGDSSPQAYFERMIRDHGLGAKSAKVKEQAILALVPLREAHKKLPLRPFLSSLVDLVSHADPGVRDAARMTLISLFSTASPAAKSDLKKEMEKKAVRKQTADAILQHVLAAGTAGGELLEAPSSAMTSGETRSKSPASDHAPPRAGARPASRAGARMAPAPAHAPGAAAGDDVPAVYIASQWDLDRTFSAMLPHFEGKETEHNWLAREQSVVKIRGMLKTSTQDSFSVGLVAGVKSIQEGILKTLASLRTTLAIHTTSLIQELALALGDDLDTLHDAFLPALLRMAGFTKRIVATAAQQSASAILSSVMFRHKFFDLLWQGMNEKTVASRQTMCEHLSTILDVHGNHRRHALEAHGGVEMLDKMLKKSLADQNKDVRAKAREAYFKVADIWPPLGTKVLDSLDAATRKQVMAAAAAAAAAPGPASSSVASAEPSPVKVRMTAAEARVTAPRKSGASQAILEAKKAASMQLAKERREREEAEAEEARRQEEEAVAEAEAEEARRQEEAEARRQEEEARRQKEESRQRLAETEAATRTPTASASHLRTLSNGMSPTPSSIPLPTSPKQSMGHQAGSSSTVSTPRVRAGSNSSGDSGQATPGRGGAPLTSSPRSRTSSSSTSHSSGRPASRIASSAASSSRFASFGQRVSEDSAGSRPLPTSTATSSSNRAGVPSHVVAPPASSVSSSSPPEANRGADETIQLGDTSDVSMDLLSSSSPKGGGLMEDEFAEMKLDTAATRRTVPRRMPIEEPQSPSPSTPLVPAPALSTSTTSTPIAASSSQTTPMATSAKRRSGLPRPVSMLYPSPAASSPSERIRHSKSQSIDLAGGHGHDAATSSIPSSSSASSLTQPAAAAVSTPYGARAIRPEAQTGGVRWFLNRAARLRDEGEDGAGLTSPVKSQPDSNEWIRQLATGEAGLTTFKKLAALSKEFALPASGKEAGETNGHSAVLQPGPLGGSNGPSSSALGLSRMRAENERGPGLHGQGEDDDEDDDAMLGMDEDREAAIDAWQESRLFERLFSALSAFLETPTPPATSGGGRSSRDVYTAGLVLLHRLVENQFPLFGATGAEADLVSLLFRLRRDTKRCPQGACEAILDSWADKTDAILGIGTLVACLRAALSAAARLPASSPEEAGRLMGPQESRVAIHTLGLRALSRVLLRLPTELIEEELPRARDLVKSGLNDAQVTLRQEAVKVMVAANRKVGDPALLFGILQPLERAQEDLLMYYMAKK